MSQYTYSSYLLIIVFFLLTGGLSAQDNCFQTLKKQGKAAIKQNKYASAIQSFQSIIRNCDKATQSERSEALTLLNSAYDLNEQALKASISIAEEKTKEAEKARDFAQISEKRAILERQAKEVEAINAKSSKIAFHASEEIDKQVKLALAYYSKKWLNDIDTTSQSSTAAFGDAVQENYRRIDRSQKNFVNAATVLNNDILVKAVAGEITVNSPDEIKSFIAHQDHILSMTRFKNGFITTSKDNSAKYWEADDTPIFNLVGHKDDINGVAISLDQSTILTYSKDNTARIWNDQGQFIAMLTEHTGSILDAIFSSDGQYIITRSQNKEVGLWNISGDLITNKTHDAFVYDIAVSNDNDLIISTTADGQIHLWNIKGEVKTKKAHDNAVFAIKIAADSQHFLTASADKKVKLWNKSGTLIHTFPSSTSITHIDFINNHNQILIASGNKVSTYNFAGELVHLYSHDALISTVKLSKNRNYFLTGANDNSVKLWSIDGMELLTLNPFNDQIIGLDFSTSEEHILAYSHDGIVALCPTPAYIYDKLDKQPPTITKELKRKYGLE